MFKSWVSLLCTAILYLFFLSACAPSAKLTYHKVTPDITGYNFVIPRTVINVSVTNGQAPAPAAGTPAAPAPGAGATERTPPATKDSVKGGMQLSLGMVPSAYDASNNLLPVFTVTDDSAGVKFWTPTTLTSVSYADRYIVSSIGTQVTDNRSQAFKTASSVLGLLGTLGVIGFAAGEREACDPQQQPPPFAIDKFDEPINGFVPGTKCWGYDVQVIHKEDGPDEYPLFNTDNTTALPLEKSVPWFPYPACRSVKISVYACDPNSTMACDPLATGPNLVGTANVSLGKFYRRSLLPVKGKITFHPDFCVADVTNDSSGLSSEWALLQQAITDYQGLLQTGKAAPAKK